MVGRALIGWTIVTFIVIAILAAIKWLRSWRNLQ